MCDYLINGSLLIGFLSGRAARLTWRVLVGIKWDHARNSTWQHGRYLVFGFRPTPPTQTCFHQHRNPCNRRYPISSYENQGTQWEHEPGNSETSGLGQEALCPAVSPGRRQLQASLTVGENSPLVFICHSCVPHGALSFASPRPCVWSTAWSR